jgi:RNA polymerase sigma factor (sigma-70 family)
MADVRDAEDIPLLQARDHGRLLATYYPVVLERLRLRLSDADAYEVAHRVVDRLLGELDAGKTYRVPFRVVVHNVIGWKLKEFHTLGRIDVLPEDWDPTDPADDFAAFEQAYDLDLWFADLPARTRDVLRLRYLEGVEIEQIAERLGMTRNAVDQALHRGHAKLKEIAGG